MRWHNFLILMIICSCGGDSSFSTEQVITEFYQVYDERKDFEAFLSFYDSSVVLEDIINGDRVQGKVELREFFDWSNPDFVSMDDHTLVVLDIITEEKTAVVKGYFEAFKWGDTTFEAMHFTTVISLNEEGKIVKQVDWINYPSALLDYASRKNSNDWIDSVERTND